MLYSCAVWVRMVLSTTGSLHVDCTGKLGISHCSALRAILGMDNGLHNNLVFNLAGKWPLQLHIANQVYWFAYSVKDNPHVVSEPLTWLWQLDDDVFPKRLALGKVQVTD